MMMMMMCLRLTPGGGTGPNACKGEVTWDLYGPTGFMIRPFVSSSGRAAGLRSGEGYETRSCLKKANFGGEILVICIEFVEGPINIRA